MKNLDFDKIHSKDNRGYEDEIYRKYENIELEEKIQMKPTNKPNVTFISLYRFCMVYDRLILLIGVIASILIGILFPLNILVYGKVINLLVVPAAKNTTYVEELRPQIIKFGLIAIAGFIGGMLQAFSVGLMKERMGRRLKLQLYAAYMRQESGWLDENETGKLVVQMTDDIETIQTACTDKLAQIIQQITTFLSSLVVAMISCWQLSLIAMVSLPLMMIMFFVLIGLMRKFAIKQLQAYSRAGAIAEELLNGVKTVVSFNAQELEAKRYTDNLVEAEKYGIKKSISQGFASGVVPIIMYAVAGLVFYQGLQMFEAGSVEPGVIIQIFITVVVGSISMGNCIPQFENIAQAKSAALSIFQIIERQPEIDFRQEGISPLADLRCDIEFRNVNFSYPSRPEMPVLQDFNFTIPAGKTVAFIGPSGSGKSTIIQLLQRLYDPIDGEVCIGNCDMKKLNLYWMRSHIGVVHQEPPLFSGTIEENIRMGKLQAEFDEVVEAAKKANAFDFIMNTCQQFDTEVSEMSSGFSGGQKQRIAIARALISHPDLLLLDEATSALDNKSEALVQSTLEKQMDGGMTVVMVAHRLSTVRKADIIVVMKNGAIVEFGSHDELMTSRGMYFDMLEKEGDVSEQDQEVQVDDSVEDEVTQLRRSLSGSTIGRTSSIQSHLDEAEMNSSQQKKLLGSINIMKRLIAMNRPELKFVILGWVASSLLGLLTPLASLLYAQMFQLFEYRYTDLDLFHSQGGMYCGLLVIPGLGMMGCQVAKTVGLGVAGEKLTTRLRGGLMRAILGQEMAWFDTNPPGALASRLAMEASLVRNSAGSQLGIIIEAGITLVATFVLGFVFSWHLALMFFVLVPMIIASGIMQGKNAGVNNAYSSSGIQATSLVLDSLNKSKVVHALSLHGYFLARFQTMLKTGRRQKYIELLLYGLFSGLGCSALYFAYSIVFLVGSYLLDGGYIQMMQLMRVFSCLTMSSTSLGRALAMSPDFEKSRLAARSTLETLDRVPKIKGGALVPKEPSRGHIELCNVRFNYPSRSKVTVLRDVSLDIVPGQSVALVGSSGCGKSTIIQLLQRYYDVGASNSSILLDGIDIRTLDLAWLRDQMGLVQQEPVLFNKSIAENITLGIRSDLVDTDRITQVARMANVESFVSLMPNGYDTKVGQRGSLLSGGQKQRICIARALYRQPPILLLDEATSALDSQSQGDVQAALATASDGRTTISIAHRLSSITATRTVVIDRGHVIEDGETSALVNDSSSKFYAMYNASANA